MRTHKIAAIPGDGIGPEVIAAGLEVLEACAERDGGFGLKVEHFDWGSDYYKQHGVMMPPGGHEQLRRFDAHLLRRRGRSRRARPHHPVGAAARDLPAARPVRQRPADPHPARDHQPLAQGRGARSSTG